MFQKKKIVAMLTAAAVAAATMAPMTASAEQLTPEPTSAIQITTSVPTVAAHRAAETAVLILGGNLVTTDGVKEVMLDTFGSSYNTNPNQFLYNYRILGYGKGTVLSDGTGSILHLTNTVAPTRADVSGESTSTGADIYLGIDTNNGQSYEDLLDENEYNALVEYNCSTIEEMEDTMVQLAAAIDRSGTGLYGSAATIASNYVNYVEGTVDYIQQNVAEANYKKVAILAKTSAGKYILYTSDNTSGTSSNRAAEYLDDVTTNLVEDYLDENGDVIVDEDGDTQLTDNGDGSYTVEDESILTNAKVIVTTGFQASENVISDAEDLPSSVQSKIDSGDITLFNTLPDSSYGIYMNSAENALGMVALIMAVYEGTTGVSVDVEDAVAYYYSYFYHIQTKYIAELADVHFEDCVNYTGISDASSDISAYASALASVASSDDEE